MSDPNLNQSEILILEDESLFRRKLAAYLRKRGVEVTETETVKEARRCLQEFSFDFALIDVNLPDGEGFELLREKRFSPTTGVIVITGEESVARVVEALRLGAGDYLAKPFSFDELPLVFARIRSAMQQNRASEHRKREEVGGESAFFFDDSLSGLRAELEKILDADRRLRERLPPVLIAGETGTGKSALARWIHGQGPRADAPLVEVNCSALPDSLAESELFGHERGAFTDARSARIGLIEAADGGTLFLDEIPSLSAGIQAKVLTAIEDGRVRRLGGNKEIRTDSRIIAATNRDLEEAVSEGSFREDLFHRLDLFRIALPPLRERGGGVIRLAEHLLDSLRKRYRRPDAHIGEAGHKALQSYHWPGNVRELAHELERSLVLEESDEIQFPHLSAVGRKSPEVTVSDSSDWLNPGWRLPEEGFSIEEAIRRLIDLALEETGGNVTAAARRLGVNRDYVRYRLNRANRSDESGAPDSA